MWFLFICGLVWSPVSVSDVILFICWLVWSPVSLSDVILFICWLVWRPVSVSEAILIFCWLVWSLESVDEVILFTCWLVWSPVSVIFFKLYGILSDSVVISIHLAVCQGPSGEWPVLGNVVQQRHHVTWWDGLHLLREQAAGCPSPAWDPCPLQFLPGSWWLWELHHRMLRLLLWHHWGHRPIWGKGSSIHCVRMLGCQKSGGNQTVVC